MINCLPLPFWVEFFEKVDMPYKISQSGNLIQAVGERVFYYERTIADIFCLIPAVPT